MLHEKNLIKVWQIVYRILIGLREKEKSTQEFIRVKQIYRVGEKYIISMSKGRGCSSLLMVYILVWSSWIMRVC